MGTLSTEQLDLVTAASMELLREHPELTLNHAARQELRTSIPACARNESKFLALVAESLPDESEEAVIRRHVEELVVLSEGRPSILILGDDFDLENHETLPDVLRDLLRNNREAVRQAIRGVGRIEVSNHPRSAWLGTGFVVQDDDGRDLVVTNRHVAVQMAFRQTDGRFSFVDGLLGDEPIRAHLDFKEEITSLAGDSSAAVPIVEVLYIEPEDGPDLAFLRLGTDETPAAVNRLTFSPQVDHRAPVAAIGYPAKDTRQTDLDIVLSLLGDVYNKKRLAPGVIKSVSLSRLAHDCSTLGGNSGSPLVDLRSGKVLGMHYGGTYPNPINHAVPATLVIDRMQTMRRHAPVHSLHGNSSTTVLQPENMNRERDSKGSSVTIELPMRITVSLGAPAATAGNLASLSGPQVSSGSIDDAIEDARSKFGSLPGVANVRAGLLLRNGQYSTDRAIIIAIDHSAAGSDSTLDALPAMVSSYPVQVRAATPDDLLAQVDHMALEGVPRINYERPEGFSLDAVDEEMFAVFHVSPDAGWPQLREFLSRTRESLTIGLYNFATDHVETVLFDAIGESPRRLDLVLGDASIDRPHTDRFERDVVQRLRETMGDRFRYEWADGERRLFAGHYHIKVAVRDRRAFWLSSGNWEPSNQPPVDPITSGETGWQLLKNHNREWHTVVLNRQLAETFEDYIRYDLESYRKVRVEEAPPAVEGQPMFLVPIAGVVEEQPSGPARYFPPLFVNKQLHIQPLLTPDNFMEHVVRLVESAHETIDVQNQILKWRNRNVDNRFEELMNALLRKHRNGVRVRFILRSDYSPEMKEMLVDRGFRSSQIRMQSRCHTKGMIVDSSRTLIGSHNLSEHGALVNRDASLIVTDREVAHYYARIFQFDWNRASRRVRETPTGISIYRPGEAIPPGFEVVSLEDAIY